MSCFLALHNRIAETNIFSAVINMCRSKLTFSAVFASLYPIWIRWEIPSCGQFSLQLNTLHPTSAQPTFQSKRHFSRSLHIFYLCHAFYLGSTDIATTDIFSQFEKVFIYYICVAPTDIFMLKWFIRERETNKTSISTALYIRLCAKHRIVYICKDLEES